MIDKLLKLIKHIKYVFDVNYWCMSSQTKYEQYYESNTSKINR